MSWHVEEAFLIAGCFVHTIASVLVERAENGPQLLILATKTCPLMRHQTKCEKGVRMGTSCCIYTSAVKGTTNIES